MEGALDRIYMGRKMIRDKIQQTDSPDGKSKASKRSKRRQTVAANTTSQYGVGSIGGNDSIVISDQNNTIECNNTMMGNVANVTMNKTLVGKLN